MNKEYYDKEIDRYLEKDDSVLLSAIISRKIFDGYGDITPSDYIGYACNTVTKEELNICKFCIRKLHINAETTTAVYTIMESLILGNRVDGVRYFVTEGGYSLKHDRGFALTTALHMGRFDVAMELLRLGASPKDIFDPNRTRFTYLKPEKGITGIMHYIDNVPTELLLLLTI